jgi:adenine phosphoribosyltransferase
LPHPLPGEDIDVVAGLEARSLPGGAIAHQLGKGFVPIRKQGKLPGKVISQTLYAGSGEAVMEIHDDAISNRAPSVGGDLATGGTAECGIKLDRKSWAGCGPQGLICRSYGARDLRNTKRCMFCANLTVHV